MCLVYQRCLRFPAAEMVRGQEDGEITHAELAELLRRDDILTVPHQTSQLEVGVNFRALLTAPLRGRSLRSCV